MEYKIIEEKDSARNLQEIVNQHIQEGWEPLGGVCVAYSPNSMTWWYYQAMLRISAT